MKQTYWARRLLLALFMLVGSFSVVARADDEVEELREQLQTMQEKVDHLEKVIQVSPSL